MPRKGHVYPTGEGGQSTGAILKPLIKRSISDIMQLERGISNANIGYDSTGGSSGCS